jgi:hypothetical protein
MKRRKKRRVELRYSKWVIEQGQAMLLAFYALGLAKRCLGMEKRTLGRKVTRKRGKK